MVSAAISALLISMSSRLNFSLTVLAASSTSAVAARIVALAHANDGGGSIRIPASECGLVGLKPTRGRVSWGPDLGEGWGGLAIEGVVSRSVRDTAGVLDAIAGNMPGDPYAARSQRRPFVQEVGAAPGKLRIGLMKRTPQGCPRLHADCIAAVEDTARLLASLGHTVEEAHPAALDETDFTRCFLDVVAAHTATTVDQLGTLFRRKLTAEEFEPLTRGFVARGLALPLPRYLTEVQWLQAWTRRVAGWWSGGFDLLLTPTIAELPILLATLDVLPGNPQAGFDSCDEPDTVHAALQRDRAAGGLVTALLECGRSADRVAPGGSIRS